MSQFKRKFNVELNPLEPPAGLLDKVMSRIGEERELSILRARVVTFAIVFCFSFIALFPIVRFVWTELIDSGFTTFFSLLFSDAGLVLASWQNFSLSLLEALPVTSLIALSFVCMLLMISSRFLTRDLKNIFLSHKFVNN